MGEEKKKRKKKAGSPPPEKEESKPGKPEKEPAAAESEGREGEAGQGFPLPKPSFVFIISLLASQGMVHLGLVSDPQSGKPEVDMSQGKFFIDLLQVLEAKTEGNLEEDEQEYLSKSLFELRMQFVNLSKS